jgi:hypothetical protein
MSKEKAVPEGFDVGGRGGFEPEGSSRHWVRERELPGVEGVARELEEGDVDVGELAVGSTREARVVGAVELVSHDRRAEAGEVNADLVLPPCLQLAADACIGAGRGGVPAGPFDREAGCGVERVLAHAEAHLHVRAVGRIELDAPLEAECAGSVAGVRYSPGDGEVGLLDPVPLLERPFERAVAHGIFGHENHAAGLSIEPVAKGEPLTRALRLEDLNERVSVVAGRRVDREASRLVDREEVLVFVDDGDLRRDGVLVPWGAPEQDLLEGANAVVRAKSPSFIVVGARADDELRPRPARALKLRLEEDVEALPGDLRGNSEDRDDGSVRNIARAHPHGLVRPPNARHSGRV